MKAHRNGAHALFIDSETPWRAKNAPLVRLTFSRLRAVAPVRLSLVKLAASALF